jgi:hypothetical protein
MAITPVKTLVSQAKEQIETLLQEHDKSRSCNSKQEAPLTQKDTSRARGRARCKCGGANQVANNVK